MIGRVGPRYGREITCDMLGVADELKRVDPDYSLWRNDEKGRFEVHCAGQRGDSLCLALPFDRLDGRTVRLVRRTRAERAAELAAEIERDNARLEREARQQAVSRAARRTERALSKL